MARRLVLLVLAVCLTVVLGGLPVGAAGPRVTGTSVETSFPLLLGFSIAAESDTEITDIRLHYRVDRRGFADVTSEAYIRFSPSRSVDVTWEWDMRRTGGLPPGTSVEYWWTVKDAHGGSVSTDPDTVRFDDDRYNWQSLVDGKVTLYWYQGGTSFAEDLMDTARGVLEWLAEDTGVHLLEPIELYVYANPADLRGSMIFPQEWTGGVAFTRHNRIAIGISPSNLGWGRRAIAHELTHLVVHQITLNPYGELPTWLDEGLAMRSEGPLEHQFQTFLDQATASDSLLSVRSLCSPFSALPTESYLSYAQSYSLVEYLLTTYGKNRMFQLLETLREGSTYDEALELVYGFDMEGLESRWRQYLAVPAGTVELMGVGSGTG